MRYKVSQITILILVLVSFVACGTEDKNRELVIMTHDSFDISQEIITEFELANDATVVIQKSGDAGSALVRAILEKGNPSADLLYGIDNTYLGRALEEDIFVPYESRNLKTISENFILDPTNHVTPINYGYVNLNYDKKFLTENDMAPPTALEDLVDPNWKSRLVVLNPASSSPGLAFLISTIAYFGEHGEYNYLDFWRDLKNNDVLVKDGWSDAYYADFSQYGGSRPLVVSYATSPAAEVFFSEVEISEPPTGNILIDRATFMQIEGIGILKNADSKSLAETFIDFALDITFQEDLPGKMFVYPVNKDAKTPDFFKFAEVPTAPSDISALEISEKREAWIDAWTKVMLR